MFTWIWEKGGENHKHFLYFCFCLHLTFVFMNSDLLGTDENKPNSGVFTGILYTTVGAETELSTFILNDSPLYIYLCAKDENKDEIFGFAWRSERLRSVSGLIEPDWGAEK